MDGEKRIVGKLTFHTAKPTAVSFQQLHSWVIWQFPRPHKNGMCGAVRPPLPGYDWIPAIIDSKQQSVQVFAHLAESYATPETAVAYFTQPQPTTAANSED